jgi:hypothetical protein
MKLGQGAAASAARFMWGGPLMFGAAIALPLAYQWAQDNGYSWDDFAGRWNKASNGFDQMCPTLTTVQQSNWDAYVAAGFTSGPPADGCTAVGAKRFNPTNADQCQWGRIQTCPQWDGSVRVWAYTSHLTLPKLTVPNTQLRPASPTEFEQELGAQPLPVPVANEIWRNALSPFAVPVDEPKVNPKPMPDGAPSSLQVPVGDPQPVVPATNPPTWRTPVITVKPSPTPDNPWRVDIVPEDVTKPTPDPVTDEPSPDEDKKPSEDKPGLCDEYPDILACDKLGEAPDSEDLLKEDKQLSMEKDGGWDFGGACPAGKSLSLQGQSFVVAWTPFCDFATGIRPVVVGMAYLSGLLIFFGIARKQS